GGGRRGGEEGQGREAQPEPARLLRHVRQPDVPLVRLLPELDDHAHDVAAVGLAVRCVGVDLLLCRPHHLVHELADASARLLDVGGKREVDAHGRQCSFRLTEWSSGPVPVMSTCGSGTGTRSRSPRVCTAGAPRRWPLRPGDTCEPPSGGAPSSPGCAPPPSRPRAAGPHGVWPSRTHPPRPPRELRRPTPTGAPPPA